MTTAIAKIMKGDRVLVDDLEIAYTVGKDARGWTTWGGAFISRQGAAFMNEDGLVIVIDGKLEGRIIITRYDGMSDETLFEGSGPLSPV